MNETINRIKLFLSLVFAIPRLLIMIPIGIIMVIIDLPFRRQGYKEMKQEFKKYWIPNHKYIYLHFDKEHAEEEIKKFIENEYIPKYKKYLVIDTSTNGTLDDARYKIGAHQIYTYQIYNFSGETDAVIVTINKKLDIETFWPDYKQGNYDIAIKETRKLYIEETEKCLKEWRVKNEY